MVDPKKTKRNIRSILQDERVIGIMLFSLGTVSYVFEYLLNAFLANHMSANLFGDFSLAMRVLNFLAVFTLLGTNVTSKKFLCQYIQNQDHDNIYGFIVWNLRFIAISFILCIVIAIISIAVMSFLHHIGIKDIASYHLAVYTLWVAPIMALTLLLGSYIICINRPMMAYFFQYTAKSILMILFFLVTIVVLGISIETKVIVTVWILAFSIICCLEFICLYLRIPSFVSNIRVALAQYKHKPKDKAWSRVSLKLILNNIAYVLTRLIDLIIVATFSPHHSDLGKYSVLLIISGFLWLLPSSILMFVKPKIALLTTSKNGREQLQTSCNYANIVLISLMLIFVIAIFIFNKTLLRHFGVMYTTLTWPLCIITIGAAVGSLSMLAAYILAYSGAEVLLLKIATAELVMVGTSVTIGITQAGLIGATIGFTLAITLRSILLIYHARKQFDIKTLIIL